MAETGMEPLTQAGVGEALAEMLDLTEALKFIKGADIDLIARYLQYARAQYESRTDLFGEDIRPLREMQELLMAARELQEFIRFRSTEYLAMKAEQ